MLSASLVKWHFDVSSSVIGDRRSTSEIERHSARWKRRECDCGSNTLQSVGLLVAARRAARTPAHLPARVLSRRRRVDNL
ncbi:hypothetical protein RR46_12961 [Papilio xuthus]|uniref:Uncharacterized protein n=1 Tax=Papilio xuthus TaxID=66420 RepID=A0A194PK33_PAPXU|nr:hypothetical protein RR46_12961 [Papilio xuthus]